MNGNLTGARIVVTGSSRGIGAAIATALAAAGARIVINYRVNEAAARQIATTLETKYGKSIVLCQADVREEGDVERLIGTCVQAFGGLDGLVNNAHTEFTPTAFDKLSWRNVLEQIDGSLRSVFLCTKAALPYLLQSKRASVLNMSTVIVHDPASHMSARIAAKGAVEALTRNLADEYGGRAIRFNALSVGWTKTDQLQNVPPEVLRRAAAGTVLGRVANPSEIAATAVFLLSDAASYITGSVFPVAGGLAPDPR